MEQAAPTGATRRVCRHWKQWLAVVCALPPLAFALSNLWLASPWGRNWIAAKIQAHCDGLATRIGGASWSPWNGVTLREIVVSQPPELCADIADPLVRIDSLRLTPAWRACLRGRMLLRGAEFESPRIVLSVQMMSLLARQASAPTGPLAAIQPSGPPIAALQAAGESPPQVPPAPVPAPSGPPPAPDAEPPAKPAPAAPAAPVAGPPQPTVWIRLRHASFRLVSITSALPLVEIADLTSDLPVAGGAARSSLSLAGLNAHGTPLLTDFQAPLEWQAPVLSLHPVAATLAGIDIQFAGKLALLSGLPMQLEVLVPKQSPAPLALPGGGEVKAEHLATNGRFRGFLMAPATWQGDCFAESGAVAINAGGHHAVFDRGSCFIALRGGVLSCVDARVVGDELSLLGNATLFADGRAAGVVRIVAASETTVGIVKRLFPTSEPAPSLTPMNTPQRVACDLEVFGILNSLQVRLGQNGPILPLP